jgi:hypothetical protein
MKRALVLAPLIVALLWPVAASGVGQSGQYDRRPVRLNGLVPDGWGLSISRGRNKIVQDLYPDAQIAYCVGVIMIGFAGDSSWLDGNTRYWDKLYCAVFRQRSDNRGVAFVLDGKKGRTIIYRKTGITL